MVVSYDRYNFRQTETRLMAGYSADWVTINHDYVKAWYQVDQAFVLHI